MENGNAVNNIRSDGWNASLGGQDKMTVVYKIPPYNHPVKRPTQSLGINSNQGNNMTMVNERGHQVSGITGVIQQPVNYQYMQPSVFQNKGPSPKMVLQLQRDPKSGNLVMMNNDTNVVQRSSGTVTPGLQPVMNHGYHPGRHHHHQLQLKHLPQGEVTQIPHQNDVIASQPQQFHQQQNYENVTYTRTYPQANPQNYQYQSVRFISPQFQQMIVRPNNQPSGNQTTTQFVQQTQPSNQFVQQSQQRPSAPAQFAHQNQTPVQFSPQQAQPARLAQQRQETSPFDQQIQTSPQYLYNNRVVTTSRAVTTERLSHFDYGEQDEIPKLSTLQNKSSDRKLSYNNNNSNTFIEQQQQQPPAQVIGQLRQPNIISTQYTGVTNQPFIINNQGRPIQAVSAGSSVQTVRPISPAQIQNNMVRPLRPGIMSTRLSTPNNIQPISPALLSRPPNVVASPANAPLVVSAGGDFNAVRPVILTAQQAGQTFQSNPVLLQINGGKSIRGSIFQVNKPQVPVAPAPGPNNPTHVYFTLPQNNNMTAKFIKTPNGHLRPVNGSHLQNIQSQPRMYTVRYVTPKPEDGKPKQQYTVYSPIAPNNNTNVRIISAGKPGDKVILPKSSPVPSSTMFADRKRKLTPSKSNSGGVSKLTKIEPRPAFPINTQHSELLQRVNKSLDGDKEAVQKPECNTPFESFPDAFRKLMKYHIFFEPDTKECNLKRVDKLHEDVSQKLLDRKANLLNKYYKRILDDAARPIPKYVEDSGMVSILQHCVVDEREELQKDQEKLRIEKEKNILAAKRSAENVSPNPEGDVD